MTVSTRHPEYTKHYKTWKMIRKVLAGDVEKFIKPVDPDDKERNDRYRDDAVFTNFTEKTRNGLIGSVFRKPVVTMEWPQELQYVDRDVTGTGISIQKLTKQQGSEVLATGRAGLLVEFPTVEGRLNAKQTRAVGAKAKIIPYEPEQIINWRDENVNGEIVNTLIVLEESRQMPHPDDKFLWQEKIVYRVLELVNNVYTISIIDENNEVQATWTPRDYNGSTWDRIPFVFIGSEDNDKSIDTSPFDTMSKLNIAHYRNSADHEEHVHQASQSTLFITTAMSDKRIKEAYPKGMRMGVAAANNLGPNGSAWLLQTNPNDLADQSMSRKEQQAVMLGARLITNPGTNETATAAAIKHSGDHSVLMSVMDNVEDAVKQCIHYLSRFMMATPLQVDDIIYQINREYFDPLANPQEIIADLQLYNNGVIALSDIRTNLRQMGKLGDDREDEDIDEEIINANPFSTPEPTAPDEEADQEVEDDGNN